MFTWRVVNMNKTNRRMWRRWIFVNEWKKLLLRKITIFDVMIIHSQEFGAGWNRMWTEQKRDNLWASGANQPRWITICIQRIWPEYCMCVCFFLFSWLAIRQDGSEFVSDRCVRNSQNEKKNENYLITSNTFVSINPNDDNFFVFFFSPVIKSNRQMSIFRDKILGDHTELAYNSIGIHISNGINARACWSQFILLLLLFMSVYVTHLHVQDVTFNLYYWLSQINSIGIFSLL